MTERDHSSTRRRGFPRLAHLHLFRWFAEDPTSPHNLYRCRCGQVRPGL